MTDAIESSELFEQDPNMNLIEQDDGSVLIDMPTEAPAAPQNFYANLAESLDKFKLNTTASSLLELIEQDKEARKKRDEQYEEGLRRTGLGDDAPGGALFDGASRVVHPVLAEGCVDFAARAIKELYPASGPVKTRIFGIADEARLKKAKAKRDYLNWYYTQKLVEYRAEKEVLLTQLPLGGSQYEKYWFDPAMGRVCMEFVPIDKVLLPFAAPSFYTAPRVTHIQDLTEDKFKSRVRSGFYRDLNLIAPSDFEETSAQKANDKIEGRDDIGDNPDGVRVVYEVSCQLDIESDDTFAPYIVHLDENSGEVVAIYRNWAENDPSQQKLDWWVEDKFIPWRGAYGIGLPHLIGGLAASLTGALRALLDSAHINNSPGAVKLKGGRASGQNTTIAQTEVKEIEAPAGVDDVRKVIMPMPFNPPSPVLFQLLECLTNQAKGVVATAEEKIADANANMPVGTTLALIEQGSQVFSAIHARLHESQRKGLEIVCRLISQYPDAQSLQRFGLTPQDFMEVDGIEPVSDPNIFSESQRYAQFQAVLQMTQDQRVQYNMLEVHRWGLELLRVDTIDTILPKPPQPVTADPATENVAAMSGAPLKANPQQDHLAHIMTHLGFIMSPVVQMNPGPAPQLGGIMAHVNEHLTQFYDITVKAAADQIMQQAQMSGQPVGPDQAIMRAAQMAQQQIGQLLGDVAPMIQQASQVVQQKTPPPQFPPEVQATLQAAMAEIDRKKQTDAQRLQFDQQKFMQDTQFKQMLEAQNAQMEQFKQASEERVSASELNLKFTIAQMSEAAAKEREAMKQKVELIKNEQDNQQHQYTEIIKNLQDNQTKLEIALEQAQNSLIQEMQATKAEAAKGPDVEPQLKQLSVAMDQVGRQKSDEALGAVMQGLQAVITQLGKPKMIIEDAKGRPIGIQ